jgi:hypothetical protein
MRNDADSHSQTPLEKKNKIVTIEFEAIMMDAALVLYDVYVLL